MIFLSRWYPDWRDGYISREDVCSQTPFLFSAYTYSETVGCGAHSIAMEPPDKSLNSYLQVPLVTGWDSSPVFVVRSAFAMTT